MKQNIQAQLQRNGRATKKRPNCQHFCKAHAVRMCILMRLCVDKKKKDIFHIKVCGYGDALHREF